jgi:UDP-glucose 6-dehydrogenase
MQKCPRSGKTTLTQPVGLTKFAAIVCLVTRMGFIKEIGDLCKRVSDDAAALASGRGPGRHLASSFPQPEPAMAAAALATRRALLLAT